MTNEVNESSENPNVNCLEGKRCPECGSFGPFEVIVSMRIRLYDDGADDAEHRTTEYGDDTTTMCCACPHEGVLSDFDE